MFDINEELIRLEDVRDYVPSSRRGKKLAKSVVYRWALHGIRGVRLETYKIGGARVTSVEAIQRFVENLNAATYQTPAVSDAARAKKAADELSRRGIK